MSTRRTRPASPAQLPTCRPTSYANGDFRIVDLYERRDHSLWEDAVRRGVRSARTTHRVDHPGLHRLRIYMVDPATTLERILVDTGGLQPSALGPPQSPVVTADAGAR